MMAFAMMTATASAQLKSGINMNDLDNILGVLNQKDFHNYIYHKDKTVSDFIKPVIYAPESMSAGVLLKRMQKEKCQIAIVVDEYGQTDGLVTLEDIIEEIVGKIQDEHDDEKEEAHRTADEGYVMDGFISLNDLEDVLPDFELPEDAEMETLNGFLLYRLGHLPRAGEKIEIDYGGYKFRPLRIENQMIKTVKVIRAPQPEEK